MSVGVSSLIVCRMSSGVLSSWMSASVYSCFSMMSWNPNSRLLIASISLSVIVWWVRNWPIVPQSWHPAVSGIYLSSDY